MAQAGRAAAAASTSKSLRHDAFLTSISISASRAFHFVPSLACAVRTRVGRRPALKSSDLPRTRPDGPDSCSLCGSAIDVPPAATRSNTPWTLSRAFEGIKPDPSVSDHDPGRRPATAIRPEREGRPRPIRSRRHRRGTSPHPAYLDEDNRRGTCGYNSRSPPFIDGTDLGHRQVWRGRWWTHIPRAPGHPGASWTASSSGRPSRPP